MLELINTRSGWAQPYDKTRQDYLKSLDHLVVLARANGLLPELTAERLRRGAARPRRAARVVVSR